MPLLISIKNGTLKLAYFLVPTLLNGEQICVDCLGVVAEASQIQLGGHLSLIGALNVSKVFWVANYHLLEHPIETSDRLVKHLIKN